VTQRHFGACRPQAAGQRRARSDQHHQRRHARNREQSGKRPARARAAVLDDLVELERVGRGLAAAKRAIGVDDLRGAARVAAFAVGMMLLDELPVRLLDRSRVGARLEAQDGKSGSTAHHRRPV
jgi:hypothetical protein